MKKILPLSITINGKKFTRKYVLFDGTRIETEPFVFEESEVLYIPHHLIIKDNNIYISTDNGTLQEINI